MITRKQYMAKEATHREYYAQFVDVNVLQLIGGTFGKRIKRSNDPHFNDIELSSWDELAPIVHQYVGRSIATANGTGGISLSDCVCTMKEAAKQIKEGL